MELRPMDDILTILLASLFWAGFFGMLSVWVFYPLALGLAAGFARPAAALGSPAETVTVLIAAHNEEHNIIGRLDNIYAVGSADFQFSVLIAIDHSSDRTEPLIREYCAAHPERKIGFFNSEKRGKAAAHNQAMTRIGSDLVLFTDADTIFEPGFIDVIGHAFDDKNVGFCSGELSWRGRNTPKGASSFPIYWRFELFLRRLESRLGICAVGTGACCAMRPELFVPLHATSDTDCSTPLDVVQQGYACTVEPRARAVDFVADTVAGEFKARIRMTSKNLKNTLSSWHWRKSARALPFETIGLVLHKLGRWMTPFLALAVLAGGLGLVALGDATAFVMMTSFAGAAASLAALAGFLMPQIPVLGPLGSFAMANAAFAVGAILVLLRKVPSQFGKTQ
jgi:cellulose synthase/poly-beta-1,6-N-acetylglucosamine synthase-like glycosyltransferase